MGPATVRGLVTLQEWGWNPHWRAVWEGAARATDEFPARVIGEHRDRWDVAGEGGERWGVIRPGQARPSVGDWVVAREGGPNGSLLLSGILPRRTRFSRTAPGKGVDEQIVAANVDVLWVVHALDLPFNARKLERYLTVGWESGARPVLVLTKADLLPDAGFLRDAALRADPSDTTREPHASLAAGLGVPVRVVSVRRPETLGALAQDLAPGSTVALIGPSGGGKSSLINALRGTDELEVGLVRVKDGKGRHTTTSRRIVRLEGGALLLDTPGMRALQLWDAREGLDRAFEDLAEIARGCRYANCGHETEPECAVKEAVQEGRLTAARLESFRKLRMEAGPRDRKRR